MAYRASSASPLFVLCAVPVNQRILPRSRYPFKIILYSKALFTFQERQKAIDLFLSDNYSNSIQLSFFSRKTKDFHSYLFQPTGTLSPVRAFTTKSPVPTLQCPTFVFTRAVKADQGAFACQILKMKNLRIAYRKKDRLLKRIG